MKVLLHPGLHKSGTTTIQSLLGRFFGTPDNPNGWYPLPDENGPGHADAVWSLLGSHGRGASPKNFEEFFRSAEALHVGRIILSSEEFITAWPSQLAFLSKLLCGHETELIFTATSHFHRALSFWKETVKHGSASPMEQSFLMQIAGFSPKMFEDFIDAIQPTKTSLITVDPIASPLNLIQTFWSVARLDPSKLDHIEEQTLRVNESFGAAETELIRLLNSIKGAAPGPTAAAQYLMNDVFQRQDWQNVRPRTEAQVSKEWVKAFEWLSASTRSFVQTLAASGRIEVIGNLAAL